MIKIKSLEETRLFYCNKIEMGFLVPINYFVHSFIRVLKSGFKCPLRKRVMGLLKRELEIKIC